MIAVIGDIHGCYHTLKHLVDKLRNKYADIPLYCVGDLVDRGNFSLEVVEFVKSERIIFTLGNHDLMFYFSMQEQNFEAHTNWLYNGGDTTLKSYLNSMNKIDEHLKFIFNAPIFLNHADCFISHAGISKSYKYSLPEEILKNLDIVKEILKKDLLDRNSILWCRGELLNIGKLQVVGHTHRKEIFHDLNTNTLYIDTTAFGMNKLSAAIIDNNKVVEVIEEKTYKDDSEGRWANY